MAARLSLIAFVCVLLAASGSSARGAAAAECVGSVQSPVYSIQEPQYGLVKTVTFDFLAPECANDAGGGNYSPGYAGMKAGDFTWDVDLASTKAPAPQPIFGVPPNDWSSVLLTPGRTPPPPVGCQALAVVISYTSNRPGSTGSDGPTAQIGFKVSWSGAAPNTGASCSAATTTTATTTSPTPKKTPGWVQRAENAKLDLEQALREENTGESLIRDFEFGKASDLLATSASRLSQTRRDLELLAQIVPPGTASSDASSAAASVKDADSADDLAKYWDDDAGKETGDREAASKEFALEHLAEADSDKDQAIASLNAVIASAPR